MERCKIYSKLTIKMQNDISDFVLVSLFITLNRFHTLFCYFYYIPTGCRSVTYVLHCHFLKKTLDNCHMLNQGWNFSLGRWKGVKFNGWANSIWFWCDFKLLLIPGLYCRQYVIYNIHNIKIFANFLKLIK